MDLLCEIAKFKEENIEIIISKILEKLIQSKKTEKNGLPQLKILSPTVKNINEEILKNCDNILLYYVNQNHYQSIICVTQPPSSPSSGGSKRKTGTKLRRKKVQTKKKNMKK